MVECVCGRIIRGFNPAHRKQGSKRKSHFIHDSRVRGDEHELSVVQFNVALVSGTLLRMNSCTQMKKKGNITCVSLSVRDGKGLARRDGWSLAISDRRAERSVMRGKGESEGAQWVKRSWSRSR